ncbi:MAG: hypothetical protein ACLQQ4_17215 [Bacteroidia bacterium]
MKNRIAIFVFGLLAGVAIGLVFEVGIKTVLKQVRELHLSLNNIYNRQDKMSQQLDSLKGKLKDDKKNPPLAIKNQYKAPVSAPVNTLKNDSLASKTKPENDTINNTKDSSANAEPGDSNVVVMTNQLVSVTSLPLKDIDSVTSADKSNHKSDSVIASMSNIDPEKDPPFYRIEFWQSPLNFKGYKMSKGKIILYGINSNTAFRLVKWDDGYYLWSSQSVYKVEYTDDYKPFEKVVDKTVLKKITL